MRHKYIVIILLLVVVSMSIPPVLAQDGEGTNLIEYGNTEFGTLSASSPVEAWQFEGVAADLITIGMNQFMGDLDPYLLLLDAEGRVLAMDDNSGNPRPNALITDLRLPVSGTYTILAQAVNSTTGDYELLLTRDEPGMIYGQVGGGGELPYDIPMIDGLSQTSSSDQWTFEGLPGDSVSITMKRLSGTFAPYLILQAPDGAMLARNGRSSGDTTSLDNINLTALGTYTVIAQRYPGSTAAGDYELRLTRTAEGFQPTTGGGTIAYGETVNGAIWEENRREEYRFDGTPGDVIKLTVTRTAGNLEPTPTLIQPRGQSLSIRDINNAREIFEAELRLHQTGTHTLLIGRNGSTIGNYSLTFELVSSGITQAAGGGDLMFDTPAFAALWPANPEDTYTFEARPGAQIQVDVTRLSGNLEPQIQLHLPSGLSQRASSSSSDDDVYTRIYDLTELGIYTLRIASDEVDRIGDYSLNAALLAPGIAYDAGGGALAYDVPGTGALWNTNQRDVWTFDAKSGDSVNIRFEKVMDTLDAELRLYAPDGQFISASSGSFEDLLLANAGPYTLEITTNRSSFGDYALTVEHIQSLVTPIGEGALALGERVISAISRENPVDVWQFEAQEGDRISLTMAPISGTLDPFLVLELPDGTRFNLRDDVSSSDRSSSGEVQVRLSGTYTLYAQASPKSLTSLGNYSLIGSIIQTADGRVVPSGGGQLLIGEMVRGRLTNDDPTDEYRIIVDEPVVLDIALTRTDGNLNGYLEVLDAEGVVIVADDDSAGGFNPVITGLALEPGEYTIIARRPNSDTLSEGLYELSVMSAD